MIVYVMICQVFAVRSWMAEFTCSSKQVLEKVHKCRVQVGLYSRRHRPLFWFSSTTGVLCDVHK